MKIKSAKTFRFRYKTKRADDKSYNEKAGRPKVKGFFEMYHDDKPDIADYFL